MSMRNPDADPHMYKIYFTILNQMGQFLKSI